VRPCQLLASFVVVVGERLGAGRREALGRTYGKLGYYDEADERLERAWTLRHEHIGPEEPARLRRGSPGYHHGDQQPRPLYWEQGRDGV
jgi:hypothetical protein